MFYQIMGHEGISRCILEVKSPAHYHTSPAELFVPYQDGERPEHEDVPTSSNSSITAVLQAPAYSIGGKHILGIVGRFWMEGFWVWWYIHSIGSCDTGFQLPPSQWT